MHKIFPLSGSFLFLLILASACKTAATDPKAVAKAFTEAMMKGDFTEASDYTTKASKSTLEMLKTVASMKKMAGEKGENLDFFQGAENKKITYSDPKMDGTDRATVIVMGDGKEIKPLIVVREDSLWKVAIDINTIMDFERGSTKNISEPFLNQADSVISNLGTMNDSISNKLEEAKVELDSLSKAMKNQ